jgi:hypothetical protein
MPKINVNFSLINADQFTARVESGSVTSALIQFLRSIQGAKFDWDLKRFCFPITLHDQLQVIIGYIVPYVVVCFSLS